MSAPVLSWLFIAKAFSKPRKSRPTWPQKTAATPSSRNVNQETPRPNPQSQSFSRSYGSILPTSLIYIVLLTRGFPPWRPDAVMSTHRDCNAAGIFKDHPEGTRQHKKCTAFPVVYPHLRLIRFHGNRLLTRKDNSCETSVWRLPTPKRYRDAIPLAQEY